MIDTHISRAPVFSMEEVGKVFQETIEHLSKSAKSNCFLYEGDISCAGEPSCSAVDIQAAVKFFVGLKLADAVDEEWNISEFSPHYVEAAE